MKIGMMVDVYQSHLSGVTNQVSILKQYFEQQGHTVYVFSFGNAASTESGEHFFVSGGLPLTKSYYWGWRYTSQAVRQLQSMDVVHVHHPFLSGRLALRYCKPRRIPLVFTNHTRYDLYTHHYLPWLPASVGRTFLRSYMPPFCHAMDRVIAPSASVEKVLRSWGVVSPIEVIPNGVEVGRFRGERAAAQRASLGLTEEDLVFVFVGRLSAEKNLQFLLRSFVPVARAHRQARLVLVGDGPEKAVLQRQAAAAGIGAQVVFTGQVSYPQMPEYLHLGDVFVTASVTEVHPLTVLEAMAAGLPVLGVRSPGMVDIVMEGVSGFLSEAQPDALGACMERLLLDAPLRSAMAANALEHSGEYALENTAGRVLALYQTILAERNAAQVA